MYSTTNRKDKICSLLKGIGTGDAAAASVVNSEKYIEHNPQFGDGAEALKFELSSKLENGGYVIEYKKYHRCLAEGNFVLSVCEGSFKGIHSSFYDLFRVENGKVVEHWDTTEAIPPREDWKNDNGKF